MEPAKQGELDERQYHPDGTWTTKRMILLSESESQNPEVIKQRMGLDPMQWEIISMHMKRNWWDTPMKLKDEDGVEHATSRRNYQYMVELRVKPTGNLITTDVVGDVEKGFRAMRMCQAFVWDRERGRVLVLDSNVGMEG